MMAGFGGEVCIFFTRLLVLASTKAAGHVSWGEYRGR